jgi:hypothetical protein
MHTEFWGATVGDKPIWMEGHGDGLYKYRLLEVKMDRIG